MAARPTFSFSIFSVTVSSMSPSSTQSFSARSAWTKRPQISQVLPETAVTSTPSSSLRRFGGRSTRRTSRSRPGSRVMSIGASGRDSALLVQLSSLPRARSLGVVVLSWRHRPQTRRRLQKDALAHQPWRRSLASSSPQVFWNQRRQLSECAPPFARAVPTIRQGSVLRDRRPCNVSAFRCQGVALIFATASAVHR